MERGERPTAAGPALITWAGLALQFSATRVALNIVALSAGFLVVGLVVVRLDRWLGRRRA